jgi:hypothetical protein
VHQVAAASKHGEPVPDEVLRDALVLALPLCEQQQQQQQQQQPSSPADSVAPAHEGERCHEATTSGFRRVDVRA